MSEKAPRHRTGLVPFHLVICDNPMLLVAIKGAELDHGVGSCGDGVGDLRTQR